MKKIILILLLTLNLFSNEIYLKDYISMISSTLKINFVLDDEVNNKITLYLNDDVKQENYMEILAVVLENNDFEINLIKNAFNDDIFLIKKIEEIKEEIKEEKEENKIRVIQLYNIDYLSIKPLLETFKNIKFNFVDPSKLLVIDSDIDTYTIIQKILNKIDKLPEQLKLKITILDTNINKLKEYGTELTNTINKDINSNLFFNLLAFPFSVNSQVSTTQRDNFTSYIKLLNSNNLTELVAAPTLTLLDNKKVKFEVVKNIPYLSGTTTINETLTNTTNSYIYKDIGLKIDITPNILGDNIYLDLSLINETVLDSSNTPTTSKSNINQTFRMTKNNLFVLTGINQTQKFKDVSSVPLLGDIPFLGWLFKTDKKDYTNSNMTIIFELIDNNSYTDNNSFTKINIKKFTNDINLEHKKRVSEILGD